MLPKNLSRSERAVCAAFPSGDWVDLCDGDPEKDDVGNAQSWGSRRLIRADVIAALLLGVLDSSSGMVAALRLRGARITGRLDVGGSRVAAAMYLVGCRIDEPPDFTGAATRTISLSGCKLNGFSGRLLRVDGDLDFQSSAIFGCLMLRHSSVSGSVHLDGCGLCNPGQHALSGGGMAVQGGMFGRHGLIVHGTIRLIGARLSGGLFMEGARLSDPGRIALCLDQVIAPTIVCTDGCTVDGQLQLRNADIRGLVSFEGAVLRSDRAALQCQALRAGELRLIPELIEGSVDLELAQVRILRDDPATWPAHLQLDGLTYEYLQAVEGNGDVSARLAWLRRESGGYRRSHTSNSRPSTGV